MIVKYKILELASDERESFLKLILAEVDVRLVKGCSLGVVDRHSLGESDRELRT